MLSQPVYLVAAKRTPIGSYQGALAAVSATQLGAHVLRAVLKESGVLVDDIDDVILGCVLTAGTGQAPARQAAIAAGLPTSVQAMAINKVCSSGLKAVQLAAQQVALGYSSAVLAGGMESMSQAPYYLPAMRNGARLGHSEAQDSIIRDGLWDVYNDYHMGNAAELCAKEKSLTREAQDAFAIESYARANNAAANQWFNDEISPVTISSKKGDVVVDTDEEPGRGNPEKIPQLRPAFQKDGTVTAANASSINDGAAAMLVCSEAFLKSHNLTPLARIVAMGWRGQAPEWFTTAPIGAVESVLAQTKTSIADIDLFEINEAFSAVALACQQGLSIPSEKLNIHGGAVALGHPIGASGARILTTLLHAMKRIGGTRGVAAICNGGGEATSLLVERV